MNRHQLWYTRDALARTSFFTYEYFLRLLAFLRFVTVRCSLAHAIQSLIYASSHIHYQTRYRNRCLQVSRARHVHKR